MESITLDQVKKILYDGIPFPYDYLPIKRVEDTASKLFDLIRTREVQVAREAAKKAIEWTDTIITDRDVQEMEKYLSQYEPKQ